MKILPLILCAVLLLTSCGGYREVTPTEIENLLRTAFPDGIPADWPTDDSEADSRFLLHSAIYHGLVHPCSAYMTTDEIQRNLEELFGTTAVLIADFTYAPAEWDENTESWRVIPHETEHNLFYVVHDVEQNDNWITAEVSCYGFSDRFGLYVLTENGEMQQDWTHPATWDGQRFMRQRILENPENYVTYTVHFRLGACENLEYFGIE